MNIKRVKVYDVNGYKVCAESEKELEKYLSDVPSNLIGNKDYIGDKFVLAIGKEFKKDKCKELEHMKINKLFETVEEVDVMKNNLQLKAFIY